MPQAPRSNKVAMKIAEKVMGLPPALKEKKNLRRSKLNRDPVLPMYDSTYQRY